MKGLKVLKISVLRFLYFLLKVRYCSGSRYKYCLLIAWLAGFIVLSGCTKSVLFNKYVLLCRYRLIKKGVQCIATQHPSNQNNIVCFCKTATKKQIIRLILMLRLNDAAPGEYGHWFLLIRFYSVYLSSYCQKALI